MIFLQICGYVDINLHLQKSDPFAKIMGQIVIFLQVWGVKTPTPESNKTPESSKLQYWRGTTTTQTNNNKRVFTLQNMYLGQLVYSI